MQEENKKKKIILSGARPTGDLHLGNYFGALENWVRLQDEYDCHYFIADWHALTTGYAETKDLKENSLSLLADFIACGLDPERSTIFLQSRIMEHAELFLLLAMITPQSWLERSPTYKEQLVQLQEKNIQTLGFLGYPCLQAADILAYMADFVPVGEDQLPHLELSREIARRFNHLYKRIFPEPQPLLTVSKVLPGIDGRKMSKSYGNTITFADPPELVKKKVMRMKTDPARIHKTDPGNPEVCTVFAFHKIFSPPEEVAFIDNGCRTGTLGCVECKHMLQKRLLAFHEPIHEKRTALLKDKDALMDILDQGSARAREKARRTLQKVRKAMRLDL